MNNYNQEKKKLLAHIGNNDIVNLFKKAKCFIAGGALTSIFSNKDINDIDVYFKDYTSLKIVLSSLFNTDDVDFNEDLLNETDTGEFSLIYTNHTKKSILFTKENLNVQLIYFKFFNSAEEIFDTYDFTINMGAYDCENDKFIFHDNFLVDVAQRRLVVNPKTSFPIISLLRIDKYKQRGYHISRKDFINLCLAVNRLKFDSWAELADAIGGMYGYTYTDVFDTKKEYSIDEAINQLVELDTNLENHSSVNPMCYDELIEKIGVLLKLIPEEKTKTFYKKVHVTETPGVFSSHYSPSFKYKLGTTVNGGLCGVWAYKTVVQAEKHWVGTENGTNAIIKLETNSSESFRRVDKKTYTLHGDVMVVEEVK